MDEKAKLIQRQFESPESEVRIAASRQLASLTEPCMELFAVSLGDPDWRVRKAAVETFYKLELPTNFIPTLLQLLHHPENAGLRNSAIEILIGLGSQAVTALQCQIAEPDVEVRKFVIDILGEIGDSRCAEGLISSLNDDDINVRYAAVETLGKLKVETAVEPLLELMSDPDPGLKFTILQSLAQIGGDVPTERLFLYLDDRLLRKALFDCFAKVGGPEVVAPLVTGLSDPMRLVREAALCALDALRSRGIRTIKETLAAADIELIASNLEQMIVGDKSHLKEAALALYAGVGSTRDLSFLLDCVAVEELRSQVLNTFSELGQESYARLLNGFDAPGPLQRLYLIFVGGELSFDQVLPLVLEAAQSGDYQLRNAAARALGNLGGEGQLDSLLRLLDDEITDIQDTAAMAIAAYARRYRNVVLDQLSSLLSAPDADKRMRVVRILGLIDGEEIEAPLLSAFKDSSVSVRCEAIRGLRGHFGSLVISGLTLALTDESAEVRRLAVSALGQCSQKEALPALTLAAGDTDLWVRASVMRALEFFSGRIVQDLLLHGVQDPVGLVIIAALESSVVVLPEQRQKMLENALTHPDAEVVKAAMALLSRFVGKNWIGPFASALLEHPHWDVRLHAVRSLGQSGQHEAHRLLEDRLVIESEGLVCQAIESVVSNLPRTDSLGC